MTQEVASNTVRIYAAHGRSQELGDYLATIVKRLPTLPGCLSSELHHDAQDNDLWIIDVRWASCKAMSEHFAQPSNEGLNGLLNNCFVRQVAFDSDIDRCNLPGAI
jgi:quinol monooxygenase YgiN